LDDPNDDATGRQSRRCKDTKKLEELTWQKIRRGYKYHKDDDDDDIYKEMIVNIPNLKRKKDDDDDDMLKNKAYHKNKTMKLNFMITQC
jgi:hypothetical protein